MSPFLDKSRMYRMFTDRNGYKYIDTLQNLTDSINDTPSRPLGGMLPSKVNKENEDEVRLNAYLQRTNTRLTKHGRLKTKRLAEKQIRLTFKFKINDRVRISHLKRPFMREYDQKWTGEIFVVSERYKSQGIPIYRLKDFDGELISGTFYSQELQKVNKQEGALWKIEKILKTEGKGVNKRLFVKWLHWPKNSILGSKHVTLNLYK